MALGDVWKCRGFALSRERGGGGCGGGAGTGLERRGDGTSARARCRRITPRTRLCSVAAPSTPGSNTAPRGFAGPARGPGAGGATGASLARMADRTQGCRGAAPQQPCEQTGERRGRSGRPQSLTLPLPGGTPPPTSNYGRVGQLL